MTHDPKCRELAEQFFEDHKDRFPPEKHAVLVTLLANDIQQTIEDFTEYPDITLKHLERMEERQRERQARR